MFPLQLSQYVFLYLSLLLILSKCLSTYLLLCLSLSLYVSFPLSLSCSPLSLSKVLFWRMNSSFGLGDNSTSVQVWLYCPLTTPLFNSFCNNKKSVVQHTACVRSYCFSTDCHALVSLMSFVCTFPGLLSSPAMSLKEIFSIEYRKNYTEIASLSYGERERQRGNHWYSFIWSY